MITRDLRWSWQGTPISLAMDEAGEGQSVLLLPALSSISTRSEMWRLLEVLSARFRAVTVDWPGFGDRPRPRIGNWTPDIRRIPRSAPPGDPPGTLCDHHHRACRDLCPLPLGPARRRHPPPCSHSPDLARAIPDYDGRAKALVLESPCGGRRAADRFRALWAQSQRARRPQNGWGACLQRSRPG